MTKTDHYEQVSNKPILRPETEFKVTQLSIYVLQRYPRLLIPYMQDVKANQDSLLGDNNLLQDILRIVPDGSERTFLNGMIGPFVDILSTSYSTALVNQGNPLIENGACLDITDNSVRLSINPIIDQEGTKGKSIALYRKLANLPTHKAQESNDLGLVRNYHVFPGLDFRLMDVSKNFEDGITTNELGTLLGFIELVKTALESWNIESLHSKLSVLEYAKGKVVRNVVKAVALNNLTLIENLYSQTEEMGGS